jgi:rod shape-determining protein MreD
VSGPAPRLLDGLLRRLAPFLTALAAALVDLLPLPNPAPQSLAPATTVCVCYFWTLYRPDLMTPLAIFLVGLVLDGVGGLPLGLTSLSLLVGRCAVLGGQRFLRAQPFAVVWLCFAPVAFAVAAARWLFASLAWGRRFPLEPAALEASLTVAVYPVIGWLLARLHQNPRAAAPHAAGS